MSAPTLPPSPPRLLDQLRDALRVRHYSRRTEAAYAGWVRRFVAFHGLRHPRTLGAADVSRFLSSLASHGVAAWCCRAGRWRACSDSCTASNG